MVADMTRSAESLQQQRDAVLRRAESLRHVIELISSELALEPLLTRIIASATDLIGAHYGAVGLVRARPGGAVVEIAAMVNMPPTELGMEFPVNVGLAGRVLREKQPVRLARYGDLGDVSYPEFADHAVMGIPIWWGQQMVGFFGIGAEPPRHFSEQDVETITLFARHAAIAITNARRFESEQGRNERLALIAHVGHIITADLVIEELLRHSADAIHELLGYAAVSLSLLEPPDAAMSRHVADTRQVCIAGSVRAVAGTWHAGEKHALVSDMERRSIHDSGSVQAGLAFPLICGEQVLGVLEVASKHSFTDEDATSLRIIADQLGVAIEKARLFEAERRRTARINMINRIGQVITSSPSSTTLFQTTTAAMYDYFNYDYVGLGIIDPDNVERIRMIAHAGRHNASLLCGSQPSLHEGLIGSVARTNQRILVNNIANDPRTAALSPVGAVFAALVVPIIVGNRLLGIIVIESAGHIDEEEAEGIAIIADQFGAALENARLFGSMQQALELTQLLYTASQRISMAMSVEEVIAGYLEQVAIRGGRPCSILLLETDHLERRTALIVRGRWTPQAGINLEAIYLPPIQAAFTPLLDAGQTVTFTDIHTHVDVPEILREVQARAGQVALALIPLMVRGKRIGTVFVSCPYAHAWSPADLQPYQITAAQLATAIDSRQQHLLLARHGEQFAVLEERRRLARELHDSVTQSMFSMSLLAQIVPDLWELDRDEAYQSLHQIRTLTRDALAEMRALLFELRPTRPGELSLAQALTHQAKAFEQRTGIVVVVEVHEEHTIPNDVAQAMLRIMQEGLTNISRHAHAQHVVLSLTGGSIVCMRIVDDGRGFDPRHIGDGHFGLISMRERAALINARIDIRSIIGQGTEIIVEWPAMKT